MCFQYRHCVNNHHYYIGLETIFEYEHSSKYNFAEGSREALLEQIEDEEFSLTPLDSRIVIQEVEKFLDTNQEKDLDVILGQVLKYARDNSCSSEEHIRQMFHDLKKFLAVQPQLPDFNKEYVKSPGIRIKTDQTREDIAAYIQEKAGVSEIAALSLYAYRQMDQIDWKPFIKAALERNPVSVEGLKDMGQEEVWALLHDFPDNSIYDEKRLAQPDEVWNFRRGDGLEIAFLFANYLKNSLGYINFGQKINGKEAVLVADSKQFRFHTRKGLKKEIVF
jgi:hypothetical protein